MRTGVLARLNSGVSGMKATTTVVVRKKNDPRLSRLPTRYSSRFSPLSCAGCSIRHLPRGRPINAPLVGTRPCNTRSSRMFHENIERRVPRKASLSAQTRVSMTASSAGE